ncbi:hypothetical protein BURK1_03259 [Burkholderiales bacterium]|nr:hypothetical protein BURK1_03259 [Burkholderiales bacterium]
MTSVYAGIARASTLPAAFHRDAAAWDAARERDVRHFHRLRREFMRATSDGNRSAPP